MKPIIYAALGAALLSACQSSTQNLLDVHFKEAWAFWTESDTTHLIVDLPQSLSHGSIV